MRTKIINAQLAEATAAVKGLIQKDSLNPFSRVRLDAVGPNVSLTGSNGDMQVEYRVEGETSADGTLVLPGAMFCRFVDAMPTGPIEIDGEAGKKVKISGGEGVTFRLAAADTMDYPVMAGPKAGCTAFDIEAFVLKEMLRKVKFAAAADGSERAHLCGVNVKMKDWKLEMTATDGRQLAHVEKDLQESYTGPNAPHARGDARAPREASFDIILANKTVNALFGLLDDNRGEPVTIKADAKAIRITAASWSMTSKVVAGAYPAWNNVVPKDANHTAKIGRTAFLEALGRAALAAGDNKAVKMWLKNGAATFEARNDISEAKTMIAKCEIGDEGCWSFLFNPKLLKDALDVIDDDDFTLSFREDAGGPILLKCSIPWLAVTMPLRIG
jgi:DNA polymerase-3 subunit beta